MGLGDFYNQVPDSFGAQRNRQQTEFVRSIPGMYSQYQQARDRDYTAPGQANEADQPFAKWLKKVISGEMTPQQAAAAARAEQSGAPTGVGMSAPESPVANITGPAPALATPEAPVDHNAFNPDWSSPNMAQRPGMSGLPVPFDDSLRPMPQADRTVSVNLPAQLEPFAPAPMQSSPQNRGMSAPAQAPQFQQMPRPQFDLPDNHQFTNMQIERMMQVMPSVVGRRTAADQLELERLRQAGRLNLATVNNEAKDSRQERGLEAKAAEGEEGRKLEREKMELNDRHARDNLQLGYARLAYYREQMQKNRDVRREMASDPVLKYLGTVISATVGAEGRIQASPFSPLMQQELQDYAAQVQMMMDMANARTAQMPVRGTSTSSSSTSTIRQGGAQGAVTGTGQYGTNSKGQRVERMSDGSVRVVQ